MLQEGSSTWDGPQGILFLQPVSGFKILGKADRENLTRKLHWLERDGKVKLVSIVFNTSFQYTSSWYTLWLTKSVFAFLRQHFCHSLGFAHAESNKSEKCVTLSQPYTFVHLTF